MFTSEEQFFVLLIKPFLIGALAGLVFAAIDSRRNKGKQFKFTDVVVAIPIVLIAYIAGYLTGISGSSAIGNLVPAVLAFIGASQRLYVRRQSRSQVAYDIQHFPVRDHLVLWRSGRQIRPRERHRGANGSVGRAGTAHKDLSAKPESAARSAVMGHHGSITACATSPASRQHEKPRGFGPGVCRFSIRRSDQNR